MHERDGKALETNKSTLEKDKSTLRKTKLQIANVAEKLCACCARETGTTQQPTPSTTDKVTDALKTIGSSISIGIGGGSTGGHGRHDRITGEHRTRTADKLKDNRKIAHDFNVHSQKDHDERQNRHRCV